MNTANQAVRDPAQVTGPRDTRLEVQPDTLAEYIFELTKLNPDGQFIEIGRNGEEPTKTYGDLFAEAQQLAAKIEHLKPRPEQFVILCFESVLNYVPAAWACFLNGYSILPLSISGFFRNRTLLAEKVKQLSGRQGVFLVLTEPRFLETFERICEKYDDITVMDSGQEIATAPSVTTLPNFPSLKNSSSILIETSGTTGTPKLARIGGPELIARFYGGLERTDVVNLALLGQNTIGGVRLLLPEGAVSIYMDPGKMMADVGAWLDLVSRFKVTHVGLSNSMAAKINQWFSRYGTDWDLSSLKKLFFGSEMIVPDNIRKLVHAFELCGMSGATASLVYSMTETGPLFITTVPTGDLYTRSKRHHGYFNLDQCFTSWSVRIVDGDGHVVQQGEVGAIQAYSATRMFRGYHPDGDGILADGWFDTGDLGSLDENGLVLTGRKKSTIIINARKISTESVELVLSELEGIKPGMIAAAPYRDASSQTDELAVFFTPLSWSAEDQARLSSQIHGAVSSSIGVKIDHLVPIREDQFTRTASGKFRRHALCNALREGDLEEHKPVPNQDVAEFANTPWLQAKWRQILKLNALPQDDSHFFNEGGDSLASIELFISVEKQFRCRISLEKFYQNPTLANLTRLIEAAVVNSSSSNSQRLEAADVALTLRKHEVLCASWEGTRAVPDGLIVGRNVMGTKTPLFWVFQSDWEFAALVENLDPDQPVYGIRSLAGLFSADEYSPEILKPLCSRLLLELTALRPTGDLVVGGNCQGAIIAIYLARQLQQMNRIPKLLVLMEWMFSHGMYKEATLFLYGRESHTKEVYTTMSDTGPNWRSDFPNAIVEDIDGGHGRFFHPELAPSLVGKLNKHLEIVNRKESMLVSAVRRVFRRSANARARSPDAARRP